MDAERITEIIKSSIMADDASPLDGCFLFGKSQLLMAIRTAAYEITTEIEGETAKPEPPEPPKTVLPDMSGAELGKPYRFIGDDGTEVEYRHDSTDDHLPWIVLSESGPDSHYWLSTNYFIAKFPYLGRLHKAVPGEVAE